MPAETANLGEKVQSARHDLFSAIVTHENGSPAFVGRENRLSLPFKHRQDSLQETARKRWNCKGDGKAPFDPRRIRQNVRIGELFADFSEGGGVDFSEPPC